MKFIDKFFLLPEEEVFVVRPLINLPKDYIQDLCEKFDIPYFIDKTNFDPQVSKRNRIRQIVSELVSMANVRKDGTNMFRKSWQNIYDRIVEVEV
jgi:tRNA(Ile)-lysidine synthase TilS/MesJ